MKKIITLIIAVFSFTITFAQVWVCDEFNNDLNTYNEVAKQYKSKGNKRWATELLAKFPIASDNTIKYQYVIKSDSVFNIDDISNELLNWYKVKVPNVSPITNGDLSRLSVISVLTGVGKAIGYMNATFINAREEITIDIKENRIRISVIILSYIGANTWNGTEVITPGSCFPVVNDGKMKDSHAMAFINCHNQAINTIYSCIKYLNEHTGVIINGQDEW